MTGRVATWGVGIAVSGIAHLGLGAALLAGLQPQEIPDQPRPKSTLDVTPEIVERSDATPQNPDSTDVTGDAPASAALGAGAVTTSTARAQQVPQSKAVVAPPQDSVRAAPAIPPPTTTAQSTLTATPVAPKAALAQNVAALAGPTDAQSSLAPETTTSVAATPESAAQPTVAPPSDFRKSVAPQIEASAAAAIAADISRPIENPVAPTQSAAILAAVTAATLAPDAPFAAPTVPDIDRSRPAETPSSIIAEQTPTPVALPSSTPETTATKAVLAFPDAGEGNVDPTSLAAFQSFTQPGLAASDPVRDNLKSVLSLRCARMQVNFDPDTAKLRVDGHVPEDGQRGPVLAALRAQMGGDIEVTDNLLILPAPQCGALSGIAEVGLPQSTDQITNPLIVGADTHARSFRYLKDDPLVLELTAPDYPAYIYVDYFDADGNVIHLSPNAQAPLRETTPKEQVIIGARQQGDPGLMVIVGPPYGQEIAVAFAASVPLYRDERPLVEPADAYLTWLQNQVTRARAENPDFKGEWVYFFVQTAAQ